LLLQLGDVPNNLAGEVEHCGYILIEKSVFLAAQRIKGVCDDDNAVETVVFVLEMLKSNMIFSR
jgi:hypothetical protein